MEADNQIFCMLMLNVDKFLYPIKLLEVLVWFNIHKLVWLNIHKKVIDLIETTIIDHGEGKDYDYSNMHPDETVEEFDDHEDYEPRDWLLIC